MPDLADALRAGVSSIGVVGYPPFQHVGYLLDKEMENYIHPSIQAENSREAGRNVRTKARLVMGDVPSPAFVIRLIPKALNMTPAINML